MGDMTMIAWMQHFLETDETKLIYWLTFLMVCMVVDTVLGVLFAKLNPNIKFSSFKIKTGVLIKVSEMILALLAVPFAVPFPAGLPLLYTVYTALCVSEIYSIFGHLRLVDDKSDFLEILENFFKRTSGKNKEDK
ncbi:holin [Bacillus phage Whiting18]|nr:holin [Bacillus phage Whiting18]